MPDPERPPYDLHRLIEALDRHEVEYLIVGGAAAAAYGATRLTEDADCVVSRDRANLVRLADALRELHARLRVAGMTDEEARQLPVQIDATSLDMAGMSTWMTDAGPFDVLAGLEAAAGDGGPRPRQWRTRRLSRTFIGTGSEARENHQLVPKLGDMPLWNLNARDCDGLYRKMAAAGLGQWRIRNAHVVLHRAFAQELALFDMARVDPPGFMAPRT